MKRKVSISKILLAVILAVVTVAVLYPLVFTLSASFADPYEFSANPFQFDITNPEFAKLLDVSMHTVSSWEMGKSYPRAAAKVRICALRTMGKRKINAILQEMQTKAEDASAE